MIIIANVSYYPLELHLTYPVGALQYSLLARISIARTVDLTRVKLSQDIEIHQLRLDSV